MYPVNIREIIVWMVSMGLMIADSAVIDYNIQAHEDSE
jgi:hypothetical protein